MICYCVVMLLRSYLPYMLLNNYTKYAINSLNQLPIRTYWSHYINHLIPNIIAFFSIHRRLALGYHASQDFHAYSMSNQLSHLTLPDLDGTL